MSLQLAKMSNIRVLYCFLYSVFLRISYRRLGVPAYGTSCVPDSQLQLPLLRAGAQILGRKKSEFEFPL
jgi:hypothetical protein